MNLARLFALAAAPLLMPACAGDNSTTEHSPTQPARFASSGEVNSPANPTTRFARTRVYQITRLESSGGHRGEWRALGETIRQNGSTIEFTELGSGKIVSFTAPHQITPTNSKSDRVTTNQANSDVPGQGGAGLPAPEQVQQ